MGGMLALMYAMLLYSQNKKGDRSPLSVNSVFITEQLVLQQQLQQLVFLQQQRRQRLVLQQEQRLQQQGLLQLRRLPLRHKQLDQEQRDQQELTLTYFSPLF
jgi:hypothetical protein